MLHELQPQSLRGIKQSSVFSWSVRWSQQMTLLMFMFSPSETSAGILASVSLLWGAVDAQSQNRRNVSADSGYCRYLQLEGRRWRRNEVANCSVKNCGEGSAQKQK
jgi:hypothetical protein